MLADFQIDAILDDVARSAAQRPTTAGALFDSPPAAPTREQRSTLDHCVRLAQGAGLSIPPRVRLLWVQGRPGLAAGACRQDENGSLSIALSVTADLWDLRRTIFHELRHVHDLASGRRFTREDMEVRAERFARAMMARL